MGHNHKPDPIEVHAQEQMPLSMDQEKQHTPQQQHVLSPGPPAFPYNGGAEQQTAPARYHAVHHDPEMQYLKKNDEVCVWSHSLAQQSSFAQQQQSCC